MSMFDAAQSMSWAANLNGSLAPSEDATYVNSVGDVTRSIKVIVNRKPAALPDELDRGITPSIEIVVRNDSTYGIASSELDSGGDKIQLKLRLGDAADTELLLTEPSEHTAATLTFRLGKRG